MIILSMLFLPVSEHRRSFHFLLSLSLSSFFYSEVLSTFKTKVCFFVVSRQISFPLYLFSLCLLNGELRPLIFKGIEMYMLIVDILLLVFVCFQWYLCFNNQDVITFQSLPCSFLSSALNNASFLYFLQVQLIEYNFFLKTIFLCSPGDCPETYFVDRASAFQVL